jgi:hypothetical protein
MSQAPKRRRLAATVALSTLTAGSLASLGHLHHHSVAPAAWVVFHDESAAAEPGVTVCGTERWDVKTLTDPLATSVGFDHVTDLTVSRLGKLKRGSEIPSRRTKEKHVYRVKVLLDSLPNRKLGFKIEKTDSDIHLAVRDSSGATMVAEFPNKGCTAGAQHRAAMEEARKTLITACGPPNASFRELKGEAIITGVLFFDFFHHQRGAAPNVAELHPVLSFEGTCSRA